MENIYHSHESEVSNGKSNGTSNGESRGQLSQINQKESQMRQNEFQISDKEIKWVKRRVCKLSMMSTFLHNVWGSVFNGFSNGFPYLLATFCLVYLSQR